MAEAELVRMARSTSLSWPLSSTSGGWLSMAHGRQVMEARLDKAREDLRRAVDEATSLRAELHAAEA
jgi:hypothetical protein